MNEQNLLKVSEVAKLFAVQPATVRLWLRTDVIKGVKIGGGHYWRIPESEVNRLGVYRHGETNAQA